MSQPGNPQPETKTAPKPQPTDDLETNSLSDESSFTSVQETWSFQMSSMSRESAQHFKNFLRYAADRNIISEDQLGRLVMTFEQFVDDETASVNRSNTTSEVSETEPEDDTLDLPSIAGEDATDAYRKTSFATSPPEHRSSVSVSDFSNLDSAVLNEIESELEHPLTGVKVGRRRVAFKHYHGVFVASEAIDWMIARGFVESRADGVKLGRALAMKGFIAQIAGKAFEDSKHLFFRFTKHPQSFPLHVPSNMTGSPSPKCTAFHNSILQLVYHVHENSVLQWLESAQPEVLHEFYPTLLLWSRQNPELSEQMAVRMMEWGKTDARLRFAVNGFTYSTGECLAKRFNLYPSEEEMNTYRLIAKQPPSTTVTDYQTNATRLVHPVTHDLCTVELRKEFVSSAKPVWLKFHPVDQKAPELPDLIGKFGDDLRKDLCVQLVFKACEAIWGASSEVWCLGRCPSTRITTVVVTDAKAGFIEFVRGRTIKEVANDDAWKDVDLYALAPSLVGAMVSGFVLGVRDRHSENWMLLDEKTDHPTMMQIDFGYMLMENPGGFPLDTPRLTMQAELVHLFRKTPSRGGQEKRSLLDDLRADVITAYRVLRRHHPALVSFAKVTLSALYSEDHVESFMWGKHCFRSGQSEDKALAWFEDKVRSQLYEHNSRRVMKHALVTAFYGYTKMSTTLGKNMKAVSDFLVPSHAKVKKTTTTTTTVVEAIASDEKQQ